MVFSPSKKFNDYHRYIEEKLNIEKKVHKFPFRDLSLKNLIKKQQQAELDKQEKQKKKVKNKNKSSKNMRIRLVTSQSEKFSL